MKLACACAKRNNPGCTWVLFGFAHRFKRAENWLFTKALSTILFYLDWSLWFWTPSICHYWIGRYWYMGGNSWEARLVKKKCRQMERSNLLRAIATQYGNSWFWCLARSSCEFAGFAGIKILQATWNFKGVLLSLCLGAWIAKRSLGYLLQWAWMERFMKKPMRGQNNSKMTYLASRSWMLVLNFWNILEIALALFSPHFEKSFCTLMSLQCEIHFYRTRFPLQIGIPQLNRYMLNLLLMMNLLTFPLYACAFYMMVLCAIRLLQHQVRWQYTKQTPKVVLMVISLTCQRLLLRTYALGADRCTTQYNQPKNTFAENCALDNAQAEVVQLCIRLCLPLSFVVLHSYMRCCFWISGWTSGACGFTCAAARCIDFSGSFQAANSFTAPGWRP